MTSKSASVFALDVSCAAALEKGRQLCMQTATEKMLYAPHDELGLVLTGASTACNPLYDSADGKRYGGIRVESGVGPTTAQFLEPLTALANATATSSPSDILETLIVCTHLLHERTAGKKYSRTIYLITDARHEVGRKQEIQAVLTAMGNEQIGLMVIGVDFSEESADTSGDWSTLPVKAQNERVLHFICNSLGESSMVVSIDEAMEGMQSLRRRKILQRPLLKVVLAVGDIRLAVQLFTKCQEEKLPSLKRVTVATGEEVAQTAEYVRVGAAEADGGGGDDVVPAAERVKAYHYGRSLIPCTEADLDAMKIKGLRSLETIAFVGQHEVPPYILMGGVKVILPLAGDLVGQKGFMALTQAMAESNKAMVVRHVRTKDANPSLGVCFPSCKDKRHALYFAPLPFAEDVRQFRFPEYDEVACTTAEEQLVADLVGAMTVDKNVLRPNESFNPVIQQYYATLREKLLKSAAAHPDGAEPALPTGGDDVPQLIPQLQATSTAFTSMGNPLEPVLRNAAQTIADCASAFPFVEVREPGAAQQRGYWFRVPAAADSDDAQSVGAAPSTVAAPAIGFDAQSTTGSLTSTVAATGHLLPSITHVSTIDPVGSFHTLTMAHQSDPLARTRAMDELVDIIFQLLRFSMKDAHYSKCDACILALRQHCVAEEESNYYNNFLVKLLIVAGELGHGEGYWSGRVLINSDMQPITKRECPNSSLPDEEAARCFMSQDRSVPAPDLGDVVDDDLLDLIS